MREANSTTPDHWKRIIALLGGIGLLGGAAALAVIWLQPAPKPEITVAQAPVELPKTSELPTNNGSAEVVPVTEKLRALTQEKPILSASVNSMRQHVMQAEQALIDLSYNLKDARQSFDRFSAMSPNVKNAKFIESRQEEELRYNTLSAERDGCISKYVAEVEWLAEHDVAVVDAAVKLELDKHAVPTIDKTEAANNAQFLGATKLVAGHVRDQRQQHLTPETVTYDANSLMMGGSK